MLGLAVGPAPGSRTVVVYYTAKGSDAFCTTNASGTTNPTGAPRNRVSSFQLGTDDSVGDGGCDYRGGVGSPGDSGCGGRNDAARDPNILNGKILRITLTGRIPAANPYQGTGSASCRLAPAAGPEDLAAAANSDLLITVTATDSGGVSATASRTFSPQKVSVTPPSPPGARSWSTEPRSAEG
ncbi:hypothetical protein C5E02_07245 [Rathayibacter rathayi]|uniref:Uncharacterized protein n=1 Tax=Rathayibacter rathayi TaxID=33887 RepID=A0ABD6WBX4_RATRA|nr:hypothetical protein [Rathayibacter rathayi]SOE05958.1 hypothetical protein SAMN06295924_1203 [Rathayibacter rathayi NCPPB 2980 = VKM Ac-1601]AZZ49065.1 hypothetical protein C1O28_07525 [Rathayibacter rathayi]PPF16216.1 hypothetical protein C5C04_00015 [Rathayibacter rathayi]PPF51788.1 hypothetical protein C5C08_00015 [Rathayibacter rathayi]PPF83395.1 hypothetical protein C5C14_00020 [Rathayibacter rathayi]